MSPLQTTPTKLGVLSGSCGAVRDFSYSENSPTRARRPEENAGITASFQEGGAKSGAVDIQGGATWAEIRALFGACDDLSPAARRKLITLAELSSLRHASRSFLVQFPALNPVHNTMQSVEKHYTR